MSPSFSGWESSTERRDGDDKHTCSQTQIITKTHVHKHTWSQKHMFIDRQQKIWWSAEVKCHQLPSVVNPAFSLLGWSWGLFKILALNYRVCLFWEKNERLWALRLSASPEVNEIVILALKDLFLYKKKPQHDNFQGHTRLNQIIVPLNVCGVSQDISFNNCIILILYVGLL